MARVSVIQNTFTDVSDALAELSAFYSANGWDLRVGDGPHVGGGHTWASGEWVVLCSSANGNPRPGVSPNSERIFIGIGIARDYATGNADRITIRGYSFADFLTSQSIITSAGLGEEIQTETGDAEHGMTTTPSGPDAAYIAITDGNAVISGSYIHLIGNVGVTPETNTHGVFFAGLRTVSERTNVIPTTSFYPGQTILDLGSAAPPEWDPVEGQIPFMRLRIIDQKVGSLLTEQVDVVSISGNELTLGGTLNQVVGTYANPIIGEDPMPMLITSPHDLQSELHKTMYDGNAFIEPALPDGMTAKSSRSIITNNIGVNQYGCASATGTSTNYGGVPALYHIPDAAMDDGGTIPVLVVNGTREQTFLKFNPPGSKACLIPIENEHL